MKTNRYIRQIQLKEFGPVAQRKLREANVLVVGAGGLGVPVLQYLNAMGVGTLGIVEQDRVERTNLHRQLIYTENDLGLPKIKVAVEALSRQNEDTHIVIHDTFLVKNNALEIIRDYDVVVDASDNFATRYLVNDACVMLKKPFIYGALHGFEGQLSVFNLNGGPTYRCVFPIMPTVLEIPNCDEQGVLGVLPGIIGSFQALETVKVITGIGETASGKLLLYNGLDSSMYKIDIPVIKENLKIDKLASDYQQLICDPSVQITPEKLYSLMREGGTIQLIDVRDAEEYNMDHLPGSKNIPLDEITNRSDELDIHYPVYLICQSGIRSLKALHCLSETNIKFHLYHLDGGIDAFKTLVAD
ncbi:MAG: HesA/MoeB/ThiF family protein [Flavobacteriaceae bacterium]